MDDETIYGIRCYIGSRIAYARQVQGADQAELAEQLADYYGGSWTRQRVGNLEKGRTQIPVEMLCAIATVQGQEVSWYFAGAPGNLAGAIPG